jgi:hypothetical protein
MIGLVARGLRTCMQRRSDLVEQIQADHWSVYQRYSRSSGSSPIQYGTSMHSLAR